MKFATPILLSAALFATGWPAAQAADTANTLYQGKLVRLQFYLTPGSNAGWGGKFAKSLKSELLDAHFDGSTDTIFKIEARAQDWYSDCREVAKRITEYVVAGQLVYSVKTIRPNKQTLYESAPIGVSRKLTQSGDCTMQGPLAELQEEALTNTTRLLSLAMSQAEGKDVASELQAAADALIQEETATSAYIQAVGNVYVGAVDGAGSLAAGALDVMGSSGMASGLAASSNNPGGMEMINRHQQQMFQGTSGHDGGPSLTVHPEQTEYRDPGSMPGKRPEQNFEYEHADTPVQCIGPDAGKYHEACRGDRPTNKAGGSSRTL